LVAGFLISGNILQTITGRLIDGRTQGGANTVCGFPQTVPCSMWEYNK